MQPQACIPRAVEHHHPLPQVQGRPVLQRAQRLRVFRRPSHHLTTAINTTSLLAANKVCKHGGTVGGD